MGESSIVYETLAPLLDHYFLDVSESVDLPLQEDPDASPPPCKSKDNKKKRRNKSGSAIETTKPTRDCEISFLNNKSESSPGCSEMASTVLRMEINDEEESSNMHNETGNVEIEYFSLDVPGSNLREETVAKLISVSVTDDVIKVDDDPPWTRAQKSIRSPLLLLHQEITKFCQLISPTPEEQASRMAAVERVSDVIKFIWPHCQVKVFGSFETGLYLPTSDIDVVILNSDVRIPQNGLKAVAKALTQKSIAKKIQVIGKARVPIVKFFEKESNVAFDISFDVQNGPEAAEFIKDAIAQIPPLRPLCLILKIFLQQRELNEVYSGGIGSYALLVMLMTHLQMHWSRQGSMGRSNFLERNLGILLIDFFDLYGRKLNAWDVGVSCRDGGQFFPKSLRGFLNSKRPYLLSVEDPQAPENDIGKNSFNISKVRAAFAMAYRLLTDIDSDAFVSSQYSILGRIIRVERKMLERKVGFMEVPQLDNILSLARHNALRYTSDSDPDQITLHPLIEDQGKLLERWQPYDDEPLPRGGVFSEEVHDHPSSKRKWKRKWNEEKVQKKKHIGVSLKVCKRQKKHHFSRKDEKQLDTCLHHSRYNKYKKRKENYLG